MVEDFRTVRVCDRCRYTISPGWYHEEQPQPKGASHVVCNLRSAKGVILRGPLTEVLTTYFRGLDDFDWDTFWEEWAEFYGDN